MLSKIRKSFYYADDVKFSQDVSTAEGRSKKLERLRVARKNSTYQFLLGAFMFCYFMVAALIIQSAGGQIVNNVGYITIPLANSLVLIILGFATYFSCDSQIKMLLLFEHTQPKG